MTDTKTSKYEVSRRAMLLWVSAAPLALKAVPALAETEPSLQDLGVGFASLPEVVIYRAKRIITMSGDSKDADAVAVVGARILAVGNLADLETLAKGQPYRVDNHFADKIIIAGLIDQHVHPVLGALTMTLDIIAIEDWILPTGTSKAALDPESYLNRLKAAEAALTDPTEPLITWGYHHYWHGMIRRPELDAISATRPIIVWHRSAHECILNTAALKRLGITREFVDGFDAGAKAQSNFDSGHFYEMGFFTVMPKLAPVLATKERLFAGLELTRDYMHRAGVTLSCEPGGVVSKPLQDAQNIVMGAPDAPFRMYYMPDGKTMAQLYIGKDLIGETKAILSWGAGKTAYIPGQVKLFADGAIYSQLMKMTEGYTDGHKGEWIMEPELFDRAFDAYWSAGYHIHIHQNGDEGLDLVLNALERNMRRNPRSNHRTTIVHFGYARSDQIPRIRALGAIVSANPYYVSALSDRYAEIGLGKERAERLVPVGEASKAGLSISFHSDMPMAPGQPLFLVWAAVNRTTPSGRVAGPEQRLSVEQALRAVTIDAAYSLEMENDVGSIEPGKLANFTILEEDPFEVAPEKIKDIGIWGTVTEGTIFPVKPLVTKKASLFPENEAAVAASSRFEFAEVKSVAERGAHVGCSCCGAATATSCASAAPVASSVGCCATNALGWTVAAHWAAQLARG